MANVPALALGNGRTYPNWNVRTVLNCHVLLDGPEDAALTVALARGAGAPMDSSFMAAFASGLMAKGLRVCRFEFPYMEARRRTGARRPPDRAPVLLDCWRDVISELGAARLVIGGKSLGGRIASMVADETDVRGLVCLGYPFHPPGKPVGGRIDHLRAIAVPTLILQGERDTFGGTGDVAGYDLAPTVRVHWIADGDHGFKPRAASGRTEADNWAEGIDVVVSFLGKIAGGLDG